MSRAKKTPKTYSITDVSKILGVAENTVYRYVSSKKINAVKIGTKWRIAEDEISRILGGEASLDSTKSSKKVATDRPFWYDPEIVCPADHERVLVVISGSPRNGIELDHYVSIGSKIGNRWLCDEFPLWSIKNVHGWADIPKFNKTEDNKNGND